MSKSNCNICDLIAYKYSSHNLIIKVTRDSFFNFFSMTTSTIGAACVFTAYVSPAFCGYMTGGKLKRKSVLKKMLAVSTVNTTTTSLPRTMPTRSCFVEKKITPEGSEERGRRSVKDYFDEANDMIRSGGGSSLPRWFSPLECGSHTVDSPLLLYLPGIDGVGLGLIRHHQRLGEIFDIWCLHIPVKDRTSFTGLVKLIERAVISENNQKPNRPIYLAGESLGACLALAVAARNPDIDLVLILSNPATSFNKSQLQLTLPLLELLPSEITTLTLPYILSLMTGDPVKIAADNVMEGFSIMPSCLLVLADILPKETLLWKIELIKSASAYANARPHAVKAQTLILCSGKDQLLPSQEEGERLRRALPNCHTRSFVESGHFLFLEDDVDLVTIIKGASFYRRGRNLDYVLDYMPPTASDLNKVMENIRHRWLSVILSPVMFSTLEDGKIVKGLSGIPSEGPVLLVGYHMLFGIEVFPMVPHFLIERNILLRGIAHPMMFYKNKDGESELGAHDFLRLLGAVPVSAANFYKLMSSKSHILLYPGGMREALHRKHEEYKLFWPDQAEFIRMAARFGAKIVPFGAVGEDDIAQVVFDYNDQMKIPYLRNKIKEMTESVAKLRTDASGEVANQQAHLPGLMPKVPGRLYYYFGKPIETEGRKQELIRNKERAHELYSEVKSEVEKYIDYLKEKREKDPYRHILSRLAYQSTHGFDSEVPTFEP